MSNYKHGDIVVMNTDDFGAFYVNEQLTYLQPAYKAEHSILKNIHGSEIFVPNDSFDLRDKPEFEKDDLVTGVKGSVYEGVDLLFCSYKGNGCLVSNTGGRMFYMDTSEIMRQPDVKPEFEIGDLIEASNHADFELVDQVYFVADASKVKSFDGDYPIVTASDMGTIQHFKYARKYVEKTYTIKYDCVEYPATKGQYDLYHSLKTQVTA